MLAGVTESSSFIRRYISHTVGGGRAYSHTVGGGRAYNDITQLLYHHSRPETK